MAENVSSDLREILEYKGFDELLKPVRVRAEVLLKGKITKDLVEEISKVKKEPDWVRRLRLRALEFFEKLPMPKWIYGIEELNLESLIHYIRPAAEKVRTWGEMPSELRSYYEKLGLPEAEAKILAGLATQYESEIVYSMIKQTLAKKGVILEDMDTAIKKYPDLVKKYLFKVYPFTEHKFAALHAALWSGGVFVYVPPGVRVTAPIEAFFLIGTSYEAQFEHTLIVADKGSYLEFLEGCAAPVYSGFSFHDGMVEIYVAEGAHVKFMTVQNWSRRIVNFNNKRAVVEKNGKIEWVEVALGSKSSFVYPSSILKGEGATSSHTVATVANGPYWKDSGAKVYHLAPDTKSKVISKSISANGGVTVYRGLVKVIKGAKNAVSHVNCDSLILDEKSKTYTYPHNQVDEPTATVTHEATAGRISEEQLFYLQSRGLSENQAKSLVVLGFLDTVIPKLPEELAYILKKVITLEFKGVG